MKVTNSITSLDKIEQLYQEQTTISHRKKFAQFFTPLEIAQIMAGWILGNKETKSILEPAFGLGIFSRILLRENPTLQIKAFEIDPIIFNSAKEVLKDWQTNIDLQLVDYIYNDWDKKYNGIICNPPYLKFHDYSNKEALLKFEQETTFKLNGFSNLYVIFLLKSLFQLEKNGRMAYIIPSEFQNSDYGERVKEFILNHGSLRYVININSKEKTFDDAITTACILLFSNDENHNDVEFINIDNINNIKDIISVISNYPLKCFGDELINVRTIPQAELNANIKWKNYSQEPKSQLYSNLVPFSKYGKVSRGIATGSNDFFTMNATKVKKFNINQQYLSPCICKSINMKSSFFTQDIFDSLLENNKPVYLLNITDEEDPNIKKYLDIGVSQGVSKKYLTSKRTPWYAIEKRLPSPIWVSVFNRSGLKFIKNEIQARNLTTYHCLYNNHIISDDLLFAYLITDTAKDLLEENSREYGNGLQKFEPNDINKSYMLDLNVLGTERINTILELYQNYRLSEINGIPARIFIKQIDEILVERFKI